jgi:hypothetical protein
VRRQSAQIESRFVSSRSAKHRKPKRGAARNAGPARHRKPSPIANALQNHPGKTAAAVTGAVLIAAGAPIATHWAGDVGVGQAAALSRGHEGELPGASASPSSGNAGESGSPSRSSTGRSADSSGSAHRENQQPAGVYKNPFRDIKGMIPERIDQGVDFGGHGPIYALGDAVITQATAANYGWPGGGWITYRLTSGPGKGLMVFVAEYIRPTVKAGQHVTADTVIADMYKGGGGIESGWAMPNGFTAESQLSEAGGISGSGPFPTKVGLNFEELLLALGAPPGNNFGDSPAGLLPSRYPADWPGALKSS